MWSQEDIPGQVDCLASVEYPFDTWITQVAHEHRLGFVLALHKSNLNGNAGLVSFAIAIIFKRPMNECPKRFRHLFSVKLSNRISRYGQVFAGEAFIVIFLKQSVVADNANPIAGAHATILLNHSCCSPLRFFAKSLCVVTEIDVKFTKHSRRMPEFADG